MQYTTSTRYPNVSKNPKSDKRFFVFFYDLFTYSEEQYRKDLQIMANNMPSSSGMGNNNMRKGDRRDDRMQRGGSMSGSGYNNNNKMNRSAYQDNDGWIQQGGNKGRGGNNSSTSFDPSKFRTNSVSIDRTHSSAATHFPAKRSIATSHFHILTFSNRIPKT